MEENVKTTEVCQPQPTEETVTAPSQDTTPAKGSADSAFLEVKFNKEIRKLTSDEAVTLAQKGMKFDLISANFEKLKELSRLSGKSVGNFLSALECERREKRLKELTEDCGGNEDAARRLLDAETVRDDLSELRAEFPEISEEAVPDEVKTAAKEKGTGLLLEYLLYLHRQRTASEQELLRRKETAEKSLGPLSSGTVGETACAEFIKGVWGN